ncbi:hypothetical protein LSH36_251g02005 [Paralvinella palmiformis]|uniref:Uncharacterized protein n=1 Tax=Paralvinella palmiformis TaxID=53620 RepID=A0AAD9N4E0_9ANNE|nr:hypothetical protein LSH36_251g02005 [Paralvinella palmiformis]
MNGRSLKRDNRFTVGNDVLVTIPQAMYGGKGGWRLPGVGRGGAGKGWIQPINRPRTVIGKAIVCKHSTPLRVVQNYCPFGASIGTHICDVTVIHGYRADISSDDEFGLRSGITPTEFRRRKREAKWRCPVLGNVILKKQWLTFGDTEIYLTCHEDDVVNSTAMSQLKEFIIRVGMGMTCEDLSGDVLSAWDDHVAVRRFLGD